MSISFRPFIPKTNEIECGICLLTPQEDTKKIWVTHSDDEKQHPMHRKCLFGWVSERLICPYCYKSVNPTSIFSLKEKTGLFLQKQAPTITLIAAALTIILASDYIFKEERTVIRSVVIALGGGKLATWNITELDKEKGLKSFLIVELIGVVCAQIFPKIATEIMVSQAVMGISIATYIAVQYLAKRLINSE